MTAQPLVCPSCRTWFEAEGEMVRCPACGSCFRAEGAILDRARSRAEETPELAPAELTGDAPSPPAYADADVDGVEAADSSWQDSLARLAFLAIGVLLAFAAIDSASVLVLIVGAGFIAVAVASAWLASFGQGEDALSGTRLFIVELPTLTFKLAFWGSTAVFYIASCTG